MAFRVPESPTRGEFDTLDQAVGTRLSWRADKRTVCRLDPPSFRRADAKANDASGTTTGRVALAQDN